MTKEAKIAELINIRDNFNYTLAPREVFDDAIKALEQEHILDKIRAEIENTMKYQYAIGENQYAEGFEKSLEIIDKYKEYKDE